MDEELPFSKAEPEAFDEDDGDLGDLEKDWRVEKGSFWCHFLMPRKRRVLHGMAWAVGIFERNSSRCLLNMCFWMLPGNMIFGRLAEGMFLERWEQD